MDFVDEETIALAVTGDHGAFTRIAKGVERPLAGFVARTVGYGADVADLCQEILLRVYRGIGRFDGNEARFSTWFFTIAINVCRDHLRRRRVRRAEWMGSEPDVGIPGHADPPFRQAVRREEAVVVESALQKIPPEQREVVVLRLYQQLTFREIGVITGTTKDTAKSRMRYALEKLRDLLREE